MITYNVIIALKGGLSPIVFPKPVTLPELNDYLEGSESPWSDDVDGILLTVSTTN